MAKFAEALQADPTTLDLEELLHQFGEFIGESFVVQEYERVTGEKVNEDPKPVEMIVPRGAKKTSADPNKKLTQLQIEQQLNEEIAREEKKQQAEQELKLYNLLKTNPKLTVYALEKKFPKVSRRTI